MVETVHELQTLNIFYENKSGKPCKKIIVFQMEIWFFEPKKNGELHPGDRIVLADYGNKCSGHLESESC